MDSALFSIRLDECACDYLSQVMTGLSQVEWFDDDELVLALVQIKGLNAAKFLDVKENFESFTFEPFNLQFDKILVSQTKGGRTLISACVEPKDQIDRLAHLVDGNLRSLNFFLESRILKFHRIRLMKPKKISQESLSDYVKQFSSFSSPYFRVVKLELFQN